MWTAVARRVVCCDYRTPRPCAASLRSDGDGDRPAGGLDRRAGSIHPGRRLRYGATGPDGNTANERRSNWVRADGELRQHGRMLIRRECPDDVDAIRTVTTRAFDGMPYSSGSEPRLVDALRSDPGWIPALSLVAEVDRAVVGHVVCTRATVAGRPALGLGPLSVDPAWQLRGVGSALMHAVLGAADALGEPVVVLLGSPAFYHRYGFRLASEYGIDPPVPEWAPSFQARTLSTYREDLRGPFEYAAPFRDL
jgi:putative acetyltransferase